MGTSLKMEIQDGRHVLIKIVCISGTIGPILAISTPNYTISMASFHLDPFLTPQNQYVITQIQDGSHFPIIIVIISATTGPIHAISTPNYTISMASFHLDPFSTPQNQDVITQIQDGSHFLACSLLNVKIKRIKVHEREK